MTPAWFKQPIHPIDPAALERARQRQNQLTKPQGSLGVLEELAIRLAAMQNTDHPRLTKERIVVFAADHGVAKAGISAFPQSVTGEMLRNFARGGAAINVIARELAIDLEVVDVGVVDPPENLPGVVSQRAGNGTADFRFQPAMSTDQLSAALRAGRDALHRAREAGCNLIIGGEMGIGNTTPSAAITAVLLGLPPESVAGPGTGVDQEGMARKARVIQEAIKLHQPFLGNALETMRRLGGLELAALCGLYTAAAQAGIPALVDGVIATASALVAVTLRPPVKDWLFFAHRSAEPGHLSVLRALQVTPLLDLGLRLGEGSGAGAAVPLLRLACALHREMATFAEASVSESVAGV